MKLNSVSESKRVKLKPRRGGVCQSVIMSVLVFVMMIVTNLSMIPDKKEMKGINWKTTETCAAAEGKYLKPSHVALNMGSVKCIQSLFNHRVKMSGQTPEWAKGLRSEIISTRSEVNSKLDRTTAEVSTLTCKINDLGNDFTEFKGKTTGEIKGLKDSVDTISKGQEELKERMDKIEKEKTDWQRGVEKDKIPFNSRGSRSDIKEEDRAIFEAEYDKMRRSIGLAPYSDEDFTRIKAHLKAQGIPLTKDNILSASLMDFWSQDMGIDDEGVELLSSLVEHCWWTEMPMRKNDAVKSYVIYARFKNETGRLTCYHHARLMNDMCKKKGIEPRRIFMDIAPQLEKRFGTINKLQKQFRDEMSGPGGDNEGSRTFTRIEMDVWNGENSLVMQYRFSETETWRTLDAERHFRKTQIPGVRYQDKVPWVKRPKAYRFNGVKTPPGRCRKEVPRKALTKTLPKLAAPLVNNNTGSSNNNSAADPTAAASRTVSTSISSASAALSSNLLDLDGLEVGTGNNPFSSLDPTKPSFVHPKQTYGYVFDTSRKFTQSAPGTEVETTGGSTINAQHISNMVLKAAHLQMQLDADKSTDTSSESTGTKRSREEAEEGGEKTKSKSKSKAKKSKSDTRTNSQDIKKMLEAQKDRKKKEEEAKDDDPEEEDEEDEDVITLTADEDDFKLSDLGASGRE